MGNKIPFTGAALQDTTAFACLHDTNKTYEAAEKAYNDSTSKLTSLKALFNGYVFSSIKYAATGVVAYVQAVAFTALAAAATATQILAAPLGYKKPWEVAKQQGDKAHASVIIFALAIFGTIFSSRTVKAVNNAAEATRKAPPDTAIDSAKDLLALAEKNAKAIKERNLKEEVDATVYEQFVSTQYLKPTEERNQGHITKFDASQDAARAEIAKKLGITAEIAKKLGITEEEASKVAALKVDPNDAVSKLYLHARAAVGDIQTNHWVTAENIQLIPTKAKEFDKFTYGHFTVKASANDKKFKGDGPLAIEAMTARAEAKFQEKVKEFDAKANANKDDKDGLQKIADAQKALEAAKTQFLSDFEKRINGEDGIFSKAFKVAFEEKDGTKRPVLDFAAFETSGNNIFDAYGNFLRELKNLQNTFEARLNNDFIEPPKPAPQSVVPATPAATNGTVTGANGNRFVNGFYGLVGGTRNLATNFFRRWGQYSTDGATEAA